MHRDPASRFRRFIRAVTREVGALDLSFLDRGRPLGAARVINAIGSGHNDIADIREYLGLDSGLMSRLLRGLEKEGLITTEPNPQDGRRRIARLTRAGTAEYETYERLSDARARDIIARAPQPENLLAAMDLIALVCDRNHVKIVEVDPRSGEACSCLAQYYAELERRFESGFDVSRSRDPAPHDMVRPKGAFLVALSDRHPIGCVGLKGTGEGHAEIKRLWVSREARGFGIGKRLMTAVEDVARELGITTLRLDTNKALPEAAELYRRTGWAETSRFNDDPYADYFFEKRLDAASGN